MKHPRTTISGISLIVAGSYVLAKLYVLHGVTPIQVFTATALALLVSGIAFILAADAKP